MKELTRIVKSLDELDNVAAELLGFAAPVKIFLLHGQMGAGKTTLVKSFCKVLEVSDTVNSPTFSIVQEYVDRQQRPVYHFDLYRVKKVSELFDLGFEQYIDQGTYCFIEWPEIAEVLLNQSKADIFITTEDHHRVITCRYE